MKLIAQKSRGFHNRILKRLPALAMRKLRKHLQLVTLARRDSLHEPGEPFRYVYFPEMAMISLLTVMSDGAHFEVGSVGCEGMVGLAVMLGATRSTRRALCQMPGTAYRLSAAELRRQTRRGGPLAEALQRYALAFFDMMAQLSTCNRLHSLEQRCASWLLLTHDRVSGNDFHITHEFLSEMLCARRSGITVAAGSLQRTGLIEYQRGQIRVLKRRGLERKACECYATIRKKFER